jgi:hypothetical protein
MRMTSIRTLQPHEFTAELAFPIFEEVTSAAPVDREVNLDIGYVVSQWQKLSEGGLTKTWAAFVGDEPVGLLGGLFIQEFWSGMTMGMEQFWFVKKAHRRNRASMKLFRKFEVEARVRKCQTIWAGSNIFHDPERMKKLYEKMGFELWGQNFRKVLR